MSDTPSGFYANVTPTDIQLASAYLPLLIELAKDKKRVSYAELIGLAKARYPDLTVVKKAIAVSTGRRLDVVRMFTGERGLPDLTMLVVNRSAAEGGPGVPKDFDSEAVRAAVLARDWSTVAADFAGFAKVATKAITPRKKIREPGALAAMSAYYIANRETLPESIRDQRDLLIELLMEGFTAEEAFGRVQAP